MHDALKAAFKCEPIDPRWPIQGPDHAMELLREWDPGFKDDEHVYHLTHAHAFELEEMAKLGEEQLYRHHDCKSTKYISISWHLAGRYEYDNELVAFLKEKPLPLSLIDFGAACWIQAIFYAKNGLDVTVVNAGLDSDANRFGRWLAEKSGLPAGAIKEYASDDPAWAQQTYDIIYAVDVLEHIPPLQDGSPGWIPIAEKLRDALVEGGLWYVNAPLDKDTTCHRVDYHPVHFTSPISMQEWEAANGLRATGYFSRFKRS